MNSEPILWINTRDKPGLLLAMMREFKNNSHISFEGSLGHLSFSNMPSASNTETEVLKRQTLSSELDFVIIPLTDQTVQNIWKVLSEKDHLVHEGIIHVQIESNGNLVFGGYDNFHRQCVIAYSGVSIELLERLKEKGVIRGYEQSNA
ncbi:MAG: hypothetical protein DRR08_27095 [Candidatus Parabeggiatoa sp. nov. 2]|nr:MAG: hypothetical protein B6247_28355 [Beggiatoa sp. 4572_84]RKZ53750.1 MAG: hypothetical protein DRR08_27095 [Gammaproteobacteria bacterium]